MSKQLRILAFTAVFVMLLPTAVLAERTRYVTIGTGSVTGVYYPTGNAISKIVNKSGKKYNLRATVESTGGSVFNVNAIMTGDLEFGIVQSDRQYQAYKGTVDWEGRPQKNLRSVFSIHPETVTLISAASANIRELKDLKGKAVIIGNPGSGQQGNALDVLEAAGIDYKSDLKAEDLRAADAANFLQSGQVDAYFYTVGHPNDSFREATSGRIKTSFVPIDKIIVDKLVNKFPYYVSSTIPVEFYPGVANKKDVPSFGVKATFCTSADVDEEIVYAIVKEVFDNFDKFKKLHPAYKDLTRENMLLGLTAPLHPGAEKYYREAGLLN